MKACLVVLFILLRSYGGLGMTQGLALSQRCLMDTNSFLSEMNMEHPKEYAVRMYDAFGKMGSNVEGGNTDQPGLLKLCQSAQAPTFAGQYCQVFLRQGSIEYFVGICVPDSCTEEDVQLLVLQDMLKFGRASLLAPFPSILVNDSTQEVLLIHCVPDTVAPNMLEVTCLFVCCMMVAIPLAASLFTAITTWQRSREVSPAEQSSSLKTGLGLYGTMTSSTNSSSGPNTHTFPLQSGSLIEAFSLQTTTQGVLSTSSSIAGRAYPSLHGIRVLSLLWIMCGHSAQYPIIASIDNYKNWKKAFESSPLYVFSLSGPVFLAVDTFLLLGGLLSARSLLSSIQRADDTLSLSVVIHYLFSRIKRIQPLHIFITCLTIGLMSVVHWGPYWFPFVNTIMDCKSYWWANLLLVSNLLPVHEICVPWTWYLSLDFQCYTTTPLLVFLYRLNKSVFGVVAGGLLLATTVTSSVTTALWHLPVFHTKIMTSENYVFYYLRPYTRYGPFLIGIMTGIFLTTKKGPFLNQKWKAVVGWLCCLSGLALLVGLAYVLREAPSHPSVPHALYQGLHRPLWALAITWIILACEGGYGGFVNNFLSSHFWMPFSNISFACYLTHPVFIIIYIGLQETPIHYSDINFMYLFLSNAVLTLMAASVLCVLVEKPYVLLKTINTRKQETT
ncbi:O-acyltransferase like protein [Periophthalmus magnuspinnatus]|uniref:O-acyltransferase like protein n=1 Tax=Periophthalmus magnuspinnatus TaxID=409849 RepID=UPI002436857B|nr:O-acyltransferase like protein [Periophthalmus magnuspinnatus]